MNTLLIIKGCPGSGKTTFADTLKTVFKENCEICSADDYFMVNGEYKWNPLLLKQAHEWCKNKAITAIHNNIQMVIIANVNMKNSDYNEYNDLCNKYNYRLTSIIMEKRHNNDNIHQVNTETIKKFENTILSNIKLT